MPVTIENEELAHPTSKDGRLLRLMRKMLEESGTWRDHCFSLNTNNRAAGVDPSRKIFPIGRLDNATTGLIVLTDGMCIRIDLVRT